MRLFNELTGSLSVGQCNTMCIDFTLTKLIIKGKSSTRINVFIEIIAFGIDFVFECGIYGEKYG